MINDDMLVRIRDPWSSCQLVFDLAQLVELVGKRVYIQQEDQYSPHAHYSVAYPVSKARRFLKYVRQCVDDDEWNKIELYVKDHNPKILK